MFRFWIRSKFTLVYLQLGAQLLLWFAWLLMGDEPILWSCSYFTWCILFCTSYTRLKIFEKVCFGDYWLPVLLFRISTRLQDLILNERMKFPQNDRFPSAWVWKRETRLCLMKETTFEIFVQSQCDYLINLHIERSQPLLLHTCDRCNFFKLFLFIKCHAFEIT